MPGPQEALFKVLLKLFQAPGCKGGEVAGLQAALMGGWDTQESQEGLERNQCVQMSEVDTGRICFARDALQARGAAMKAPPR